MRKKVIVVGAGFSGMSTAACLAKKGFDVEIFEKSDLPGGRARHFTSEGFTFDIGPQVILLPEIIDAFFKKFNHQTSEFIEFENLDPLFRIFHQDKEIYDIPGDKKLLDAFFDKYTKGGSRKKEKYMEKAKPFYMDFIAGQHLHFGTLPSESGMKRLFSGSHYRYVRNIFRDYHLLNFLEFPFPFVGSLPIRNSKTAFAFNFSLLEKGLLIPKGGMFKLVEAFTKLLDELYVPIHVSSPIESYDIIGDKVTGIITHGKNFHADYFIAATDYHYAEQLLPREFRNYSESDWEETDNSFSSCIFYLGLDKKLKSVSANSVIFNTDIKHRGKEIKAKRGSLEIPAIYVSSPSKLNSLSAPEGKDSLIIRIILPPGIEDSGKIREHYFEKSIQLIEQVSKESIHKHIVYKKTLARTDFESEFNTLKGKAFGWMSTQFSQNRYKKIQNTHLNNLFYAEHPVLLGAGISSALLTGEVVAGELVKQYNHLQS